MMRRFFSDQDNLALLILTVSVAFMWFVEIVWGIS